MSIFRKLTYLTILLVLMLVMVLPGTAYANSSTANTISTHNNRDIQDQFVFGDTYTLKDGDTLVGDLFILGGAVMLEEGSRVEGNIILVGGTLNIQGTVEKNLVAIGGSPILETSGIIQGDAITIGSNFSGNPDRVEGDVITDSGGVFNLRVFNGRFPTIGVARVPFLWDVLSLFFIVFFMTALAIGTVLLLPKQSHRTAQVLIRQPVASGGMGCLTVIMAPIILLALAITIILIPVSLLGIVMLVLLVIFGWVALGLELGNRLAQALYQNWHPAVSAGLGTFSLTLVALGISRVILYIGWLVPFLVSMIALGAVMLVFFGAGKASTLAAVVVQPAVPSTPVDTSSLVTSPDFEISPISDPSSEDIPPAI